MQRKESQITRVVAGGIASFIESAIPYYCSIQTAAGQADGTFTQTDTECMFAIDSVRLFGYVAALISLKADLIGWPGVHAMAGMMLAGMAQAGYMHWRQQLAAE